MIARWRSCILTTILATVPGPVAQELSAAMSAARLLAPHPIAARPTGAAARAGEADDALDASLALIKSNKFQEAETTLLRYIKDHPESPRACYQLGFVYSRLQNYPRSIEFLQKSIALDSANADAHKILGLDFVMSAQYDAAERALQEAVRLAPESVEIRYYLGRLYYTKGLYPLAQQAFELVIHRDPADARAYDNLGLAREASGDEGAAAVNYRRAMELVEKTGLRYEWPYINLSTLCNRQHKPQLALDYALKAAALNPNSSPAYFQMGKAYRLLENWQSSAAALEKAVALDPGSAQPYYVLSYVYRKLGKMKESRASLSTFQMLEANAAGGAREGMATPSRDSRNRE